MFEKVNPSHPDKVADRIAGAIVDVAYKMEKNPKIAAEVLLGHGLCNVICESSVKIEQDAIEKIVERIAGPGYFVSYRRVKQDCYLAENQAEEIRCGDNGIFKGAPLTSEQSKLAAIAKKLYEKYESDGKFILDGKQLIVCQSRAATKKLEEFLIDDFPDAVINPLGDWSGGPDVDAGATNRKLGSDMGDSITGGGLHGKDLSKADVSVNIYAWLKAQQTRKVVELCCAIGDNYIDGRPYKDIVDVARAYIAAHGGFEKFAEWGLIK